MFCLGHERYGVEPRFARAVLRLRTITALPHAPPFVLGLIHARGEIVTLVDLGAFLRLRDRGLSDRNRAVLLTAAAGTLALAADEIVGAMPVRTADLKPPPATLAGLRADYLKGVTPDSLAVLDAGRLIEDCCRTIRGDVRKTSATVSIA